jgi:hypothetical protein
MLAGDSLENIASQPTNTLVAKMVDANGLEPPTPCV